MAGGGLQSGPNPPLALVVGDSVEIPLDSTASGTPDSSNGGVVSFGPNTSSSNVQIVAVAPGTTTVSVPMQGGPDALVPVVVSAAVA